MLKRKRAQNTQAHREKWSSADGEAEERGSIVLCEGKKANYFGLDSHMIQSGLQVNGCNVLREDGGAR